ncbi:uncharacterized protein VTP21DRAFT_8554 [Calcarisporiella thermophila]|uniref:uncharacterized protein n=1 Tax=Calcarisporiella thermophila TaxID=911321 RepID=UPI003743EBA4
MDGANIAKKSPTKNQQDNVEIHDVATHAPGLPENSSTGGSSSSSSEASASSALPLLNSRGNLRHRAPNKSNRSPHFITNVTLTPPAFLRSLKPSSKDVQTYLIGLFLRLAQTIIIIAVLFALLTLYKYKAVPNTELYDKLEFEWRADPRSYLVPFNMSFGEYNILLDGHSHTTYSDGVMSPEQVINWHIANGYNAVIVSDHNTIKGGLEAEKIALEKYNGTIVVIPAMEYSCCRIHMNLIGINETIPFGPPNPTDDDLRRAINRTHELGGLVIVNHIPWSNTTEYGYQLPRLPDHPTLEQLVEWGIDGVEIVNGNTLDLPSYQYIAAHPEKNLIQITGTDVHHPAESSNAWTILKAPSLTKEAILAELRARRTTFLFDPAGPTPRAYPRENPEYYRLAPLTNLAGYFSDFYTESKGMYSFQGTFCHPRRFSAHEEYISYFILYLIVFLVLFEIARLIVLRLWALAVAEYRKRVRSRSMANPA